MRNKKRKGLKMRILNTEKRSYQNFGSIENPLFSVVSRTSTVRGRAGSGTHGTPPYLRRTNLRAPLSKVGRAIGTIGKAIAAGLARTAEGVWDHKILSTIGGLILGANIHSAYVSILEKGANLRILQEHGLSALAEKCAKDPDTFYKFAPTTRFSFEARNCRRMLVDRLAAKIAGKEVQSIAAIDRQNGLTRVDVPALMEEKYDKALEQLRGTTCEQSRVVFFYQTGEAHQGFKDRLAASRSANAIYDGADVDRMVDKKLILDNSPRYDD